jgi:hypothetical protein
MRRTAKQSPEILDFSDAEYGQFHAVRRRRCTTVVHG